MFPGQAPDDHVLVRAFVGGMFARRLAEAPEEVAVEQALSALHRVYGVSADPVFVRCARWTGATPQYGPEHGRRVQRILADLGQHPNLVLTAAAYLGVGLKATIAAARAAVAGPSTGDSDKRLAA
jgi:oxygen-dependent protoporphyrinogen oxidase